VVAPRDGRAVVGRPKSEDRLKGLGPGRVAEFSK